MDGIWNRLRKYVSPVFLGLLAASFVFWYIAKLNYTYTTEQQVQVNVDGVKFKVTCVVEGVGTNLFGYKVYMDKTLRIPLAELRYKRLPKTEERPEALIAIDPQSLRDAISVRFSDIKVVSVGTIPEIPMPKEP